MRPSLWRYALHGGGPDSGIGSLHREAAAAAGLTLVSGCFSRTRERNSAAGAALGLPAERIYADAASLVAAESARADGARVLVICSPHLAHVEAACVALAAGWHVVIDKPVCVGTDELVRIAAAAGTAGRGAPKVAVPFVMRYMPGLQKLRAALQRNSEHPGSPVGSMRWLKLDYLQSRRLDADTDWRFKRAAAGPAGTLADLGPHALDLCTWLNGGGAPVLAKSFIATLDPKHELDDTAALSLRLPRDTGPCVAQLTLCQALVGTPPECQLRAFGSRGQLQWTLAEEAHAAGGIEPLYQSAFAGFYADVLRWLRGLPATNLPGWSAAKVTVGLVEQCLRAGLAVEGTSARTSIRANHQ